MIGLSLSSENPSTLSISFLLLPCYMALKKRATPLSIKREIPMETMNVDMILY